MSEKLQSVRGMNDLLPAQIGVWHQVEAVLREVGWAYGYQEIRTPLVEQAELFTQSIGTDTDIVQKEMYIFADSDKQNLALRPEATASTVRACNQHGLLHNKQQRLWYMGPMFRRERPQKGRYRQFHQFGVEAFGWSGPDIDAEVLRLSARIWQRLKVNDIHLQINTLGSPQSKKTYSHELQTYFQKHRDQLDSDSLRRLKANPLRILDSKIATTVAVVAEAPDIHEFLDEKTRSHFADLCESLRQSGVEFMVNPRLVRGLDYYTSTVFEWVTDKLGAQNAVCAGGRYDQLVEKRGGRSSAAVGFALGLERVVELVRSQTDESSSNLDIYVASASPSTSAEAVTISERLRHADFTVLTQCGEGKLKKQMKQADTSGARIAILTGLAESAGTVQVKWLRTDRAQQEVNSETLVDWCRNNLNGEN